MGAALPVLGETGVSVKAKVFGGVDYKYELLHVLVDASGAVLTPSIGVSFTAPANGAIVLQVALSTTAIPIISLNGNTVYLNGGVAIAANSLYEFMVHVSQNDSVTILASATAVASVLRVFFRYNM